jgi:hypothetical protein
VIGTWRCEDEDGIQEISLNSDRSFWTLDTFKKELVTPSPLEETGSWQLKSNQLLLDSVVTWSKERNQITKTLVRITRTALVIKSFDGSKNLTYKRIEDPTCAPSPWNTSTPLSETALIGLWQTHYNTHDYQYRLMPNNRVKVLYPTSGGWQILLEGKWRISDRKLFLQFENDAHGPIEREKEMWTINAVGKDCFAVKGASSQLCIMRRIE